MMAARIARLLGVLLIAGCATVIPPEATTPTGPIQFIDLPRFDAQLGQALDSKQNTVTIEFIDKVKPSQLPERLKPWMTAVQDSGGDIKVVLPPDDLQPKGFPLLSLIPFLWNAVKGQTTAEPLQKSVHDYDAQIILKNDASGDRLLNSIVLIRK